jgi:hypothetical protein
LITEMAVSDCRNQKSAKVAQIAGRASENQRILTPITPAALTGAATPDSDTAIPG